MKKSVIYTLLGAAMLLTGCNDKWDNHYSEAREGAGDKTIRQCIAEDPDLSIFGEMLDISGYSDILNTTQTYTVWAPVNSSLSGIDLNDVEEVKRTVANHISRFNISSSVSPEEGVKMVNGKMHYFSDAGSMFGDVAILQSDMIAKNGLLHKIETVIPYAYNFREYFDSHSNTTKISAFISQFDEMLYQSQIPGAAESQSADTTLVSYNRLLQYPDLGIGNIASEDSLFSMVLPTDEAWLKAYNEISPYFKTYNADGARADSLQDVQTSLAIVSDLVFRTGLESPLGMDSVISTSGSVIKNPAEFFHGMEEIEASNGRLFLANSINFNKAETYNKPINIEAEEETGRTPAAGTTVYSRNVSTDNPYAGEISGQRYIEVSPTSSSRQPGITFEIPDILAGEYDIYAVFVPAAVNDAANTESTRLQFALMYMGENGKTQTTTFNDSDFLTSGDEITKICVAKGFKFPVANYYDRLWLMNPMNNLNDREITTSIYISTNVSNAEFNENKYARSFRIDRVYLVPTEK